MNKTKIFGILLIVNIAIIASFQANSFLNKNPQLKINKDHPRLLFEADEINILREKANTTHAEIWAPIKTYVLSNLNEPLPETAPDEDLSSYRNYANRLIPNAFASVIIDQDDIKSFTINYMLTLSKWEQWGEHHYRDLGLAHMLLANSLAYDWLYSQLTENERYIVRTSLGNWAEKMYEASSGPREDDWENWWQKSYMQNHHWTNNSALGIAGIALLGEDDRAQKWINQAITELSKVKYLLEGIGDGSWHESIHYQSYGLTLSLPFLKCLKTNEQVDLLPQTYLKNYVTWRTYNYLPNTTQSIFSYGDFEQDWGSAHSPQNILRFIAAEYNNQKAEWMAQKLIQIDGRHNNQWRTPWYVFEFLYYNPEIITEPPNDTELSAVFPDFSGIIWRTGWDEDALVFGIKSGAYGGQFAFESFINETYPWDIPCEQNGCQLNIGHNHDDTNGFYISKAGNWLAPESEGVGKTATSLHNTLLIDGKGQYRPEKYWSYPNDFSDSDGSIEKYANTKNYNYISADATKRYKQIIGLKDVNRQILFIRPNYFIIVDNIKANGLHLYEWVCHLGESVQSEGNWIRGNAGNDQVLGVGILSPQEYGVQTGNDGKPFVRISPNLPVSNTQFINLLYPTNTSSWSMKPEISIVNDDSASLVQLIIQSESNRKDNIIINRELSNVKLIGNYEYNCELAFISRSQDDNLEKIFIYNGKYLKDLSFNIELVKMSEQDLFIEANYIDKSVHIYGKTNEKITLYGPSIEEVFVNDQIIPFSKSGDYVIIENDAVPPMSPVNIEIE